MRSVEPACDQILEIGPVGAGPPDALDPDDPLGAFEGRKGAVLWAVSAKDGKKLGEYKLEKTPVFDGMAAAKGKLFMSLADGTIICFSGN